MALAWLINILRFAYVPERQVFSYLRRDGHAFILHETGDFM
jgi:hypothetical protein